MAPSVIGRVTAFPLLVVLGFTACGSPDEQPEQEQGSPAPSPFLIFERDSFDFGDIRLGGQSTEAVFHVRNASAVAAEDLRITSADGFPVTANTCQGHLPSGSECRVTVRFVPRLAGPGEATLRFEGLAESETVALHGMGVGQLRISSISPRAERVAPTSGAWACTQACTQEIREPLLTLAVHPGGAATWSGPCDAMSGIGQCTLRMDSDKEVALTSVEPGALADLRVRYTIYDVGPTSNDELFVLNYSMLNRYSVEGMTRAPVWLKEPAIALKTDAAGNAYVFGQGFIDKLTPDGARTWRYALHMKVSGQRLGLAPDGTVYASFSRGSYEDKDSIELLALDPKGRSRWSKVIVENPGSFVSTLVAGNDGAVYALGSRARTTAEGEVRHERFLQAYDAGGNLRWDSPHTVHSIAIDSSGNLSLLTENAPGAPADNIKRQVVLTPDGAVLSSVALQPPFQGATLQAFTPDGQLVVAGDSRDGQSWFGRLSGDGSVAPFIVGDVPGKTLRLDRLLVLPSGRVVLTGDLKTGTGAGASYEALIRIYEGATLGTGTPRR